ERVGNSRDRERDPADRPDERDEAEPAPNGVVEVVRVDEVGRVVEDVEGTDAEHEDDAAGLRIGELHPLRKTGLRAIQEIELRAEIRVGLRLASRLPCER